jgi:hypothetical protein
MFGYVPRRNLDPEIDLITTDGASRTLMKNRSYSLSVLDSPTDRLAFRMLVGRLVWDGPFPAAERRDLLRFAAIRYADPVHPIREARFFRVPYEEIAFGLPGRGTQGSRELLDTFNADAK